MADVLLTSEEFIKGFTNISDNMAGKFLQSAIREAQDIKLRGILGEKLYARLIELVGDDLIRVSTYAAYKDLLDKSQYFLAYNALVEVLNKCSYKITNAGVVKTSDDNVQNASYDEISQQRFYYQSKADYYCKLLQEYILEHRSEYTELSESDCNKIHANLYSAATSGIFLGGARGRRICRGRR